MPILIGLLMAWIVFITHGKKGDVQPSRKPLRSPKLKRNAKIRPRS